MDALAARKINRLTQETGINPNYGERTWRPTQSVVDLVQNHLDANTTIYERAVLKLVTSEPYNPKDPKQQELVAALSGLKYAKDDEEKKRKYSEIQNLKADVGEFGSLSSQLEGVNFEIPRVTLRVTDGVHSKTVGYEEAKDLQESWQIIGMRVQDKGAGFDSKLLGMMGASTKRESSGKRGGLGEGLKMSANHLRRAGATVRVYSRNEDEMWVGKPVLHGRQVVFEGWSKAEGQPSQTYSGTEVDFSSPDMDPDVKRLMLGVIDPRRGEGLGKYILEYKDHNLVGAVQSNTELSGAGVASGRIYVKGLLVEERADLLFSYNLGQKWAIAGRDRKTVVSKLLRDLVVDQISQTTDSGVITSIIQAVNKPQSHLEVAILDRDIKLSEPQKEVWKQSLEALGFKPGKTVFVVENLPPEKRRAVFSRGLTIISVPSANHKAIEFYKTLYPGEIVSGDQIDTPSPRDTFVPRREEATTSLEVKAVSPEKKVALQEMKAKFLTMMMVSIMDRPDVLASLKIHNFDTVDFMESPRTYDFEGRGSLFGYSSSKNVIYIRPEVSLRDFYSQVDLATQFLKVAVGSNQFDGKSQEIVTEMAAATIKNLKPEVIEDYSITGEFQMPQRRRSYDERLGAYDQLRLGVMEGYRVLNRADVTIEEILASLEKLNGVRDSNGRKPYIDMPNGDYYQVDGKMYVVDIVYDKESQGYNKMLKQLIVESPRITEKKEVLQDLNEKAEEYAKRLKDALSTHQKIFEAIQGPSRMARVGEEVEIETGDADLARIAVVPETSNQGMATKVERGVILGEDVTHVEVVSGEDYFLPFDLKPGQVCSLKYGEGKSQQIVTVKRRGDQFQILRHKKSEISTYGVGEQINLTTHSVDLDEFDESFQRQSDVKIYSTAIEVCNGVVKIRAGANEPLEIEGLRSRETSQVAEANRGKDFISSNITLSYGGEVWRDPKRILIDALQNHLDARKGELPEIAYKVYSPDGAILTVEADKLATLDPSWQIMGVSISDKGDGYTTPYLTLLGETTKTDDDIGKFGEGLKMLAASAIRQGMDVSLESRDWQAKPVSHQSIVRDYETNTDQSFEMLGYQMKWNGDSRVGSMTQFSLISGVSEEQVKLTPEQLALVKKQSGETSWGEWADVLDPRNQDDLGNRGLGRYLLNTNSVSNSGVFVDLIAGNAGKIYEKGIWIPGDIDRPMMFSYNVDGSIIDTRERNNFSRRSVGSFMNGYFESLSDPKIIKEILKKARENPDITYYEYSFLGGNSKLSDEAKIAWRRAYYEEYGDDIVLSNQSVLAVVEQNSRFMGDRVSDHLVELRRAVANENHLGDELAILPLDLTNMLDRRVEVYTSLQLEKDANQARVILLDSDKAQVTNLVKSTNQLVMTVLESLDSVADRQTALAQIVPADLLGQRVDDLRRMEGSNISILPASHPAAGEFHLEDGEIRVGLNEGLLNNPNLLQSTYIHELSHFLSSARDYQVGFSRFMMMLAIGGSSENYDH